MSSDESSQRFQKLLQFVILLMGELKILSGSRSSVPLHVNEPRHGWIWEIWQIRLNGVVTSLGYVGIAWAVVVSVSSALRLSTHSTLFFFHYSLDAVGNIIVGVLPEGLAYTVTLTLVLAYSMGKRIKGKALEVMRPNACENMAFATTMCIEKTGILTLNTVGVVESLIGGEKIDPPYYN